MTVRSVTHFSFAVVLILSLAYSMAIKQGHADVPVANSAAEIQPLIVGDSAPRFLVETVAGAAFDFDPNSLERPVLLLTFRGGWCPYCNMHLSELRHVIPQISEMGVDVIFLSGDRAEILYSSLKLETQEDIDGMQYTILSDANAEAATALGIAFRSPDRIAAMIQERGGDVDGSSIQQHGILPVPAVFAIDTDGVIQFAHTQADYKVRLPADELVLVATQIATTE